MSVRILMSIEIFSDSHIKITFSSDIFFKQITLTELTDIKD